MYMGELPRFFLPDAILEGTLTLDREDAHHALQVLRLSAGDRLLIRDGCGQEALCRLETISRDSLSASVESVTAVSGEPPVRLCFYPSVSKGDRFPWMLQKLCELGASEITPVFSERCVVRDWSEQKAQRFRRILLESAKQCGRGLLPQLREPDDLQTLLSCQRDGLTLLCHETAHVSFSETIRGAGNIKQVSIFTGPEGGYSPAEADFARERGIPVVRMGLGILRCETAPIAAAAAFLAITGYY